MQNISVKTSMVPAASKRNLSEKVSSNLTILLVVLLLTCNFPSLFTWYLLKLGWVLLYDDIYADDSGMFYGVKFFNDILMEAGPDGNIQTELILQKDKNTFTLNKGWAFPRKVYFNGDECMMPLPDDYPYLPNSAPKNVIGLSFVISAFFLLELLAFWWSLNRNN